MRKTLLVALLALFIPFSSQAGSKYYDCGKTLMSLEQQLRHASYHGNKNKVSKIRKKIHKISNKCYDSHSGATRVYDHYSRVYDHYSRGKETSLERELDSLRRVIEALNDL